MDNNCHLEIPEIIEEVKSLEILIQETESSLLAFALYRSIADRETAVRVLKERLTLPVVEFTLSDEHKNPIILLHSLGGKVGADEGRGDITLSIEERACIFFYDVEEALPDLAGYVNLQREEFAEVPHAVIFWVREHGLREIANNAPDFWAWRSGVFDFRSEYFELPLTAVQTALAEPLVFKDRGDLERRISLYQGLIREYSQQEKPDERFIAGLQVKLASAYHILGHFEQAEACSREALERSRRVEDRLTEAAALHTLGILAQEQWRLDEAEEKYRRSLSISEQIGNNAGIASSYHQLGMVAQERHDFNSAEQWYRKALEIRERLGLEQDAADEYHQLGIIAHLRYDFNSAEQWYRKSMKIRERLGLERDAASDYHQLGIIAEEHHDFEKAEQWYRKALEITESLGLERDAAKDYHQLGNIAYLRNDFDQAEQWYRKALEIFERLGHPPLLVNTLAQFGVLRWRQKHLHEAVSWFGRALAIAAEYNMRVGGQILIYLAVVMNAMGEEEFTVAWRQAFEGQKPPIELIREVMKRMQGDDS